MENNKKKLWHVAFSFDEPRPGVITLAAEDAEGAKNLLLDMSKHMRNVEIYDVVDAEELPNIQDVLKRQADMEAKVAGDVDVNPKKEELN